MCAVTKSNCFVFNFASKFKLYAPASSYKYATVIRGVARYNDVGRMSRVEIVSETWRGHSQINVALPPKISSTIQALNTWAQWKGGGGGEGRGCCPFLSRQSISPSAQFTISNKGVGVTTSDHWTNI